MPRAPAVTDELLLSLLQKYLDQILPAGACAQPSADVWTIIANELDNLMTSKSIYTVVKGNRRNMLHKLGVVVEPTEIEENTVSYEEQSDDSSITSVKTDLLEFKITLSAEEWRNLLTTTTYKRRDRPGIRQCYVLKPREWTTVIHDHFWEQTKLPCATTYKYAKVCSFISLVSLNLQCTSLFTHHTE